MLWESRACRRGQIRWSDPAEAIAATKVSMSSLYKLFITSNTTLVSPQLPPTILLKINFCI